MPPPPASQHNRSDWTSTPARAIGAIVVLCLTLLAAASTHSQVRDAPPTLAPAASIDINTASAAQLQLLPHIGPKRAAAIIADRERLGPYDSLDELTRVKGIGPRTVERIRPLASAKPGTP